MTFFMVHDIIIMDYRPYTKPTVFGKKGDFYEIKRGD